MTDESEIITLKREDRIENEDTTTKETDEQPEGPKIAFKRIVIGPFPPEFELMPDLVEHIMNQHENNSSNATSNAEPTPPQSVPQQPKPHRHHSTPKPQSTTTTNPTSQDINALMNKYYALLACLIVLVTAASVVCMKLKNIRDQAVKTMNGHVTSFQM